jgi:hypothetical protein
MYINNIRGVNIYLGLSAGLVDEYLLKKIIARTYLNVHSACVFESPCLSLPFFFCFAFRIHMWYIVQWPCILL